MPALKTLPQFEIRERERERERVNKFLGVFDFLKFNQFKLKVLFFDSAF